MEHIIHGYHLRGFGLTELILGLNVIYFVLFTEILKNTKKNIMQGVELVGGGAFVDKKALTYSFSTLTLRLSPPHSLSLPPSPPLATSINQGDGVISPVIRREEGGGRREEGRCDQAVLPNRLHTLSFGGSLS